MMICQNFYGEGGFFFEGVDLGVVVGIFVELVIFFVVFERLLWGLWDCSTYLVLGVITLFLLGTIGVVLLLCVI